MSALIRFGVSLEKGLLARFDRLLKEKRYTNRSEAIRDLIREELVKKQWQQNQEIAGAVIIIYDHHKRELLNRITDIQHDFQKLIVSTQHIHLDHHNCLEIIAVRGNPKQAQGLRDTLKAVKAVKHTALSMSSTGRDID